MTVAKYPVVVFILTGAFLWSSWKDAEVLFRQASVADGPILAAAGVGFLLLPYAVVQLGLDGLAAYLLMKPRPIGLWVCTAALVLSGLYNTLMLRLSATHAEVARRAFVASREARGLPVREEALELMFSPAGFWTTLGFVLLWCLALLGLVWWKRAHFRAGSSP